MAGKDGMEPVTGNSNGWQPSPADAAWLKRMLALCGHNAVWAIPATGEVYRVDQHAKKLVLIAGIKDDGYNRQEKVLAMIGWTIEDGR